MKSLLTLTLMLLTTYSWSGCNQPEYTICSITIGSDNEIKYIRQLITGSTTGVTSTDGCINFHEFVPPASQFGNLSVTNQPWVDQMLDATPALSGAPGSLRNNCSFIVLSGHHDFADSSGACDYESSAGCRKRNQYIYKGTHGTPSTHFYKHEEDGYQGSTGPLLDLSKLMKTQTVCGNYQREGLSPTTTHSGSALLGPDLLGVFLFACNMMRDEGGSYSATRFPNGYNYSAAPATRKEEYRWSSVSFKQRSMIMFGNAVTFFGFDSTAPVGDAMYRRTGTIEGEGYLIEFLSRNLKQTKYGGHPDFMTCYLDDLKMYKSGMPNSITSKCSVNSSIAVPSVTKMLCSSRIDVDCSCVKSGGLAADLGAYDKNCMQKCVFTQESKAANVVAKTNHCANLKGVFGQMNRSGGTFATNSTMSTGQKRAIETNLCHLFTTPYRKYECSSTNSTVSCGIEYNPQDRTQSRYKCFNPSQRDYESLF